LGFGGNLTWQIGPGYSGCSTGEGQFSPELFQKIAIRDNIKMIEIKLSQVVKPGHGHGGILLAINNTQEITTIRLVEPHTTVYSSPRHKTFNDAEGLMHYIKELRDLSNGKPVGFKLCVGKKNEFFDICSAMVKTGISPDFIIVDGGEGGTGADPLLFPNALGAVLCNSARAMMRPLVAFKLLNTIQIPVRLLLPTKTNN
jgi:glutamate synthase domain-containing protein 2